MYTCICICYKSKSESSDSSFLDCLIFFSARPFTLAAAERGKDSSSEKSSSSSPSSPSSKPGCSLAEVCRGPIVWSKSCLLGTMAQLRMRYASSSIFHYCSHSHGERKKREIKVRISNSIHAYRQHIYIPSRVRSASTPQAIR